MGTINEGKLVSIEKADKEVSPLPNDHWNRVYTDPAYFGEFTKRPALQTAAELSPFPDTYFKRQANIAFLSSQLDIPIEDMPAMYEQKKNEIGKSELGSPTLSDDGLFNLFKKQFDTENQRRDAANGILQEVQRSLFTDLLKNEASTDIMGQPKYRPVVEQKLNEAADLFDDAQRLEVKQKADEMAANLLRANETIAPDARWLFDIVSKQTGLVETDKPQPAKVEGASIVGGLAPVMNVGQASQGEDSPEALNAQMDQVLERFADMPDQQRQSIYLLAGAFAELNGVDKGVWYQAAETVGRFFTREMGERPARNLTEEYLRGQKRTLESGVPLYESRGLGGGKALSQVPMDGQQPLTPEQREQEMASIDRKLKMLKVKREIVNLADTKIDPIKVLTDWPTFEQGFYGFAGSLPYAGIASIPGVGFPAITASFFGQFKDDLLLEYPDMDPDAAAGISALAAPMAAGLELIQAKMFLGKYAKLDNLIKFLLNPKRNPMTRTIMRGTATFAAETGIELMQNRVLPILQSLGSVLDEEIPGYNWQKDLEGFGEELGVTSVTMLLFTLTGLPAIGLGEIRGTADYLTDKKFLRYWGYSEEQAERIATSLTKEERVATMRELQTQRTPENIAEGRRLLAEDTIVELLQQTPDPLAPTIRRDGDRFTVLDYDGNVVADRVDSDTALYEYKRLAENDEAMFASIQGELINTLLAAGQETNPDGFTEKIETMTQEVINRYNNMTPEEQQRRIAQWERETGKKWEGDINITAFNTLEQTKENLFTSITRVVRAKSPEEIRAVLEDRAEGQYKIALQSGAFTEEQMVQWIRDYEAATGDEILEQDFIPSADGGRDVTEAVSTMAVAYYTGNLDKAKVSSRLRAFFEALAEFWKAIFARGVRIKEAIAAGQISPEFESFLAQSVGLDPDTLVDQLATKQTLADINGQPVQQSTFSISPNRTSDPITAAAVREKDGTVFTGPLHTNAIEAAKAAGYTEGGAYPEENYGFVTQSGRFLTSLEAREYVIQQRQVTRKSLDKWENELGIADLPGLESGAFALAQSEMRDQSMADLNKLPDGITTFSGGGLVEIGLKGLVTPTVAVEYSPAIAQAYRAAHGDHVKVADIRTVSLAEHKGKFHYHASPVCKNSSLLKSAALGGGEKDLDIESAQAVSRHIQEIEPMVVTIENVPEYRKTEAASIIRKTLEEQGYTYDEAVYKASDYGSPTARNRYLLRAIKGDGIMLAQPAPVKGPGWYATVEDMIDSLPDDSIKKAQYIYRSLPEQGVDPDNVTEPLLVSGTTLFKKVAFARPNQPAFTFKATPATIDRILLPGGRVKRVTARAKARMTGIPDSYPLPEDEKTALTIIGNGVPPALVRNVFGPVIEQARSMQQQTFAVSPKQDTDYLAAVERGDMETAQRMVDEAARAAGYTIGPVYHGRRTEWNVADFQAGKMEGDIPAVFFTDNAQLAEEYASTRFGPNGVKLIVQKDKAENVLQKLLGATRFNNYDGRLWDRMLSDLNKADISKEQYRAGLEAIETLESADRYDNRTDGSPNVLSAFLKGETVELDGNRLPMAVLEDAVSKEIRNGATLVVVKNTTDPSTPYGNATNSTVYVVAGSPSQIKSADPVTYDASGNVIPLSQRFDATTPNISFSINPYPDREADPGAPLTETEIREQVEGEPGLTADIEIDPEVWETLDENKPRTYSIRPGAPKEGAIPKLLYKQLKGKRVFVYFADRMRVGEYTGLDPASGIRIPLQGGPGYPFTLGNIDSDAAWAFTDEGSVFTTFSKRVRETDGIGVVCLYTEGNIRGNKTFLKAYMAEVAWAVQSGKLTEKNWLAEANRIREATLNKAKRDGTTIGEGKAAWIPFWKQKWTSLAQAEQALDQATYDIRGGSFFGFDPNKKGQKGSIIGATKLVEKGFPNIDEMIKAMEDPRFAGLEYGDMVAAVQFDKTDTKAYRANELNVKQHMSYDVIIKGKGIGMFDVPKNVLTVIKTNKPKAAALRALSMSMAQTTFAISPASYYGELERAVGALNQNPAFRRERVVAVLNKFKRIKEQFANKPDLEPLSMTEAVAQLEAIITMLPPDAQAEVGGFRRLLSFQSPKGRLRYLMDRIAKTDLALEKYLRKELQADIIEILENAQPKKGDNKILTSNLGPDAQRVADMALAMIDMTSDEVSDRMTEVEGALAVGGMEPERMEQLLEEYGLLNMLGNFATRSAMELDQARTYLRQTFFAGRSAWKMQQEARRLMYREMATELAQGLKNPTKVQLEAMKNESAWLTNPRQIIYSHYSFMQLLRSVLPSTGFISKWEEMVRKADQGATKYRMDAAKRLIDVLRDSTGKRTAIGVGRVMHRLRKIKKDAVRYREGYKEEPVRLTLELAAAILEGRASAKAHNLSPLDVDRLRDAYMAVPLMRQRIAKDGKPYSVLNRQQYVDFYRLVSRGEDAVLSMSPAEAMQFLLSWDQTEVQERMRRQGWTDESIEDMRNLVLNAEGGMAVMQFLRSEYKAGGDKADPVYMAMFGMRMPRIENYAPTRYAHRDDTNDLSPMGGALELAGTTPGPLKTRQRHNARMRQEDALSVFFQHVTQMGHWINFAEVNRELRGVLKNPEVRDGMEATFGRSGLQVFDQWLDALAQGGGRRAQELSADKDIWASIMAGKSIASLGFSFRTLFLQVDAASRAMLAMGVKDFTKAMVDLRWVTDMPKAWNSETVQRRLVEGSRPEVRYIFERANVKPSVMLYAAQKSMVPMQYLDAALTSVTAALVYRNAYNKAKKANASDAAAEQDALEAMDQAVFNYSQPVDLTSRSLREVTGNIYQRMYMMFLSDARLKTALFVEAIGDLGKKGKRAQGAKNIAVLMALAVVNQTMVNLFKDWFDDEPDEEIWTLESYALAMMLAPLSGLMAVGAIANSTLTWVMGERTFTQAQNPAADLIDQGKRAWDNLDDTFNTRDPEAMMKQWNRIVRFTSFNPTMAAPAALLNLIKPIEGAIRNSESPE